MNYCLDLPHWWDIFSDWLYRWQTLVAGLIAIVAAIIGAKAIYRQTQLASDLARAELDRKHRAENAILPLFLNEICVACRHGIEKNGILTLPDGVTDRLFEFSRSVDDLALVDLVHKICSEIQIRIARQIDAESRSGREAILDLAEIHALSERLIRYSRDGEGAPFIVEWDRVEFPLTQAGFSKSNEPRLLERLQAGRDARPYYWHFPK